MEGSVALEHRRPKSRTGLAAICCTLLGPHLRTSQNLLGFPTPSATGHSSSPSATGHLIFLNVNGGCERLQDRGSYENQGCAMYVASAMYCHSRSDVCHACSMHVASAWIKLTHAASSTSSMQHQAASSISIISDAAYRFPIAGVGHDRFC